ncbi:MAG: hypothetical protein ABI769_09060, partial [Pseudomonadota bacterium]
MGKFIGWQSKPGTGADEMIPPGTAKPLAVRHPAWKSRLRKTSLRCTAIRGGREGARPQRIGNHRQS